MQRSKKAPTIQDVARHAQVSAATVSRVITNPERVSEPTRARVNDAIRLTGYTLNQAARSLRLRAASTILVALPEGATAEQIATGQKKIEGIKALLDKGEMEFSAAAVRYSDSPNALEGGDLGWRSLDEIPQAFAQMMEKMKPGEVVGPIRGPSGFQLLKLVEVRDAAKAEQRSVTEYNARHILVRITPTQDVDAAKAKVGGAEYLILPHRQPADELADDLALTLADAAITIGVVIILARSFLIREKSGDQPAGQPATETNDHA